MVSSRVINSKLGSDALVRVSVQMHQFFRRHYHLHNAVYTGNHFRMTVKTRRDEDVGPFYCIEIPDKTINGKTSSEMCEYLEELIDELCDMQSLTRCNAILLEKETDKMMAEAGMGAERKDEGAEDGVQMHPVPEGRV